MSIISRFTLCLAILVAATSFSQSVNGSLVLSSEKNKDFIVRNTKVILVTKKLRDTASINSDLTFNFPTATAGTGYLYLISPMLPANTEYKFRVKGNKPTQVALKYDKFTAVPLRPAKTPEERERDLEKGLLIARVAFDFLLIFQSFHR